MVKSTILPRPSNNLSFLALRNVLTEEILNLKITDRKDAIRYFGTYKNHPFFDSKYKTKVFRVSLFECSPYVIYLSNESFDGLEYRLIKEVAKSWRIEHIKCDFSNKIADPWNEVLVNVDRNVTDLAMCSIWLSVKSITSYDVSNYVDFQCGTFLVPKPSLRSGASFFYLSIAVDVWGALLISLIAMSLCFTLLAKIGEKWMTDTWRDVVYIDFTRSVVDALNVGTSHGLQKFPKESSMRALFNGWIIVSFLVGVGYSTGYASLLTKPMSSKPIDTLDSFLKHGLHWQIRGTYVPFTQTLVDSGVDNYIQLAKRIIPDNDTTDSKVRVTRDDNLGIFVKIISSKHITDIDEKTDPNYTLRIMKSCFLNYYSVVALRKYSSYTQYFNDKIRMLHEFGIITHWGLSIQGAKNNYMRPYFISNNKNKETPTKISLHNISGAFWFLLIGLGIAATVLVAENFYIFLEKKK